VALFDAWARGAHVEARELQRRILPIALAVTSSYGVPGLKAALDLSGYIGRLPRLPLQPVSSGAITDIRHALAGLKEFL